ncbi:MAG: hypothetical protein U0835_18200 [Isosphaeraceae bacterium]
MTSEPDDRSDERELHFARLLTVFSVSSGMVGVCITAIGLILVVERLSTYKTLSDLLLVFDAMLFLGAALFSFIAMRLHHTGRGRRFILMADAAVLCGIVGMVIVCGILAAHIALSKPLP